MNSNINIQRLHQVNRITSGSGENRAAVAVPLIDNNLIIWYYYNNSYNEYTIITIVII